MQIILSDFMSLDGVVQAPGGKQEDVDGGFQHGGWSMPFFDPVAMGTRIGEAMEGTDALLFGRRTWQTMAAAWPERDDGQDPFTTRMNSFPKYVASRTLTEQDLTWNNSRLLPADDALGAIRTLRDEPGGGLQVMGSTTLAHQLLSADLVDEINVMLEPIVLGGGKRLFPDDGTARAFELVSSAPAATGVLMCSYRRVRS
jgi:dihydrofolate reductase